MTPTYSYPQDGFAALPHLPDADVARIHDHERTEETYAEMHKRRPRLGGWSAAITHLRNIDLDRAESLTDLAPENTYADELSDAYWQMVRHIYDPDNNPPVYG